MKTNRIQTKIKDEMLELINSDMGLLKLKNVAISKGGNVGIVGGAVRDIFTEFDSKDIDLIVLKLSIDEIIEILEPFGKTDLVGKSFGVIKFKAENGEIIDIAIPRKEVKTGNGHTGFEIISDKDFEIIDDLQRRDFTCNSIVLWLDGTFFDPFDGITAINEGILRMVNPNAFAEDPLRILRAIGFLSRFGFTFDNNLNAQINDNVTSLSEITHERIFEEFKKFAKGESNLTDAINAMNFCGISQELFGHEIMLGTIKINSFIDMMIAISGNIGVQHEEFTNEGIVAKIESVMTIDKNLAKFLKVELDVDGKLTKFFTEKLSDFEVTKQLLSLWNISKGLTLSISFFKNDVMDILFKIFNGRIITSPNKLDITGFDLMELGIEGAAIQVAKKELFDEVLKGNIENKKEELIKFIK